MHRVRVSSVAGAADVLDLRVAAGLELELAAQIADVRVDAAVVGHELAAERLLGQRLARDDLAGRAHQQLEHAEFRAGQRHGCAGDAHLVHAGVQGDRSDLETSCDAPRRAAARAAQYRANARHQLARIERLAEIVVGAELQADDAVDVVAARGQHQHRRRMSGAELAQDIEVR